ncbi:Arv1-domain-containing protein [Terfezia boudieri ATCC MYA-4762]|uniref:Protein ARV n=1 Tax=Terfezia boudieri ATCC MYA-4762 TaxID=1051890 RepID=A0A3N4LA28_9PEZI|nr:Arv1-domain-containing protein [Terfezia boudieri ATCC MYA-4762]
MPQNTATFASTSLDQPASTATSASSTSEPPPGTANASSTYLCIECTYPVTSLYTPYSNADDRALGRGVRLTQCPRCKGFADKYVEHDFVVLFIDLVLMKPQVYRHLLFNRLGREDDQFDPSILRLGILLLLFDVYLTWARIEKEAPLNAQMRSNYNLLTRQPIVLQYLFFLLLCTTESLLSHLLIRLLTRLFSFPRPNAVSTALLVSSCTKLFPILMVIWDYDVPAAAKSVGWAVVVNNVEALRILLGVGYFWAAGLALVGALVRGWVEWGGWCGLGWEEI